MSGNLIELNDNNFSEITRAGVVLIDFWAPWCGPCRAQTPILEAMAPQVAGKAVLAKINVDEQPALATQFNVRSIPTLLILRDGNVVKQLVGLQQAPKLLSEIESA